MPSFRRWLTARPTLRSGTLALIASLLFALFCNLSFWTALVDGREFFAGARLLFWTGLLVTGLQWLLLLLVINRWTARPLLALLALLTAAAVYFMTYFHIYLDQPMLRNLLETDVKEASELLDPKMLLFLLFYFALPVFLLGRVQLQRDPWKQAVARRLGAIALALTMTGTGLWMAMDNLVPTLREHKEMRFLVTPANYIYSLTRIAIGETRAAAKTREVIAADAKRNAAAAKRRPVVMVVVIGETVRAANWGLNGYARQTTPELAARDVINFPSVKSCGTNTETSIPCMFSVFGRHNYNEERIRNSDSLLHVVNRAGVSVLWRDNQSGCKGVCAGLPVDNLSGATTPGICADGRCLDEILLGGLKEKIDAASGDMLIVLHTLGNHGPAYFQRYPPAFRHWTPTCDGTDLGNCPRTDVVNAYDNAILYTDHVLAGAIDLLKTVKTHDTALLYVSDHGESLGENNLYLHSLPYAIAPDFQTRVPMILWLSPAFTADDRIDAACLRRHAAQPASHDNLFHTVLGLLDIGTSVYDQSLDLSAACRK